MRRGSVAPDNRPFGAVRLDLGALAREAQGPMDALQTSKIAVLSLFLILGCGDSGTSPGTSAGPAEPQNPEPMEPQDFEATEADFECLPYSANWFMLEPTPLFQQFTTKSKAH